jgi:hypothetical protein
MQSRLAISILAGLAGVLVGGLIASYVAIQGVNYTLSVRLLGDATQDMAPLEAMGRGDFPGAMRIQQERLKSTLVGLTAQQSLMTEVQRAKSRVIFDHAAKLGIREE